VHISHCAKIAFQSPCFKVELMRIACAVWLFQADGELPAFPCVRFQCW